MEYPAFVFSPFLVWGTTFYYSMKTAADSAAGGFAVDAMSSLERISLRGCHRMPCLCFRYRRELYRFWYW